MEALAGLSVLLVEDDEDGRVLLAEGLQRYGADVTAVSTGAEALASLEVGVPHVLVSDLRLPDMDGIEVLRRVRRHARLGSLPAIALTGDGSSARKTAALDAGFNKHVLKPSKLIDVVSAIVGIDQRARSSGESSRALRSLLAELNEKAPCRFTSLLRFTADGRLQSVWTHDRENPDVDPFPLGLPIEASYCILVQSSDQTCIVENARIDPRTTQHPKRDELATYIGVPVRGADGRITATVCSYDAEPRELGERIRGEMEKATRVVETSLSWLLDSMAARE